MFFRKAAALIAGALSLIIAGGCASTTVADHAKRNAHISMKDLLGDPPSPEERRKSAEDSLRLAIAAHDSDDAQSALRYAYNTIQNNPSNIRARKIHAESLYDLGNYQQAELGFEALIKAAPDDEIYVGYGLSLIMQDQITEGRAALLTASELNPASWRALNGLGLSYAKEEKWAAANKAYLEALGIDAEQAEIHNNLGASYIAQGKYPEALGAFKKARALSGNSAIYDTNFRLALALNGNSDQALMGLTDIEAAELYNRLGETASSQGRTEEAIGYLKKAIAIHPSHYAAAAKNLEAALITP